MDDAAAEELAEIRRAIALSLEEQRIADGSSKKGKAASAPREVIDIPSSSDEDDDRVGEAARKPALNKNHSKRALNLATSSNIAHVDDSDTDTGSPRSDKGDQRVHRPLKRKRERSQDEGIAAVMAMSSAPAASSVSKTIAFVELGKAAASNTSHNMAATTASATTQNGLAGLDRAAMERERLARMAAREKVNGASTALAGDARTATKLPAASNPTSDRLARIATLSSLAESRGQTRSSASQANSHASSSSSGPLYTEASSSSSSSNGPPRFGSMATLPGNQASEKLSKKRYKRGVLKPTASAHHTGYDCFRFQDIIGDPSELDSALLTTFCGDPEWIRSHFPERTKIALVMPCADHGRHEVTQVAENMKVINPKRDYGGRGVMHIKLMLLYYKDFLRVAISTANLIEYDWSIIENAVYVRDFSQVYTSHQEPSHFLETLLRVHDSLGTPKSLYSDALLRYDFSSADDVRLVLSVPGTYRGEKALRSNGHLALASAVQYLDKAVPVASPSSSNQASSSAASILQSRPASNRRLTLECQGSSIGSYTIDWMRNFYRSAMGWDFPGTAQSASDPETSRSLPRTTKKSLGWQDDEWPNIKIVYPTFKTVKQSIGGPAGGGTIFCPLDTWNKPKFPRHLFYDSRSRRQGLLQHTKMILAIIGGDASKSKGNLLSAPTPAQSTTVHPAESPPQPVTGWLYVGTPAAWGRYNEKTGTLSVSNHELGVVVPLDEPDVQAQADQLVTWRRPLEKYTSSDTPWDQYKYGK